MAGKTKAASKQANAKAPKNKKTAISALPLKTVLWLTFLLAVLTISLVTPLVTGRIIFGVRVGDLNLSLLSSSQAESRLGALTKNLNQKNLMLQTRSGPVIVSPEVAGLLYDSSSLAQDAYNVGRKGSPWQKSFATFKTASFMTKLTPSQPNKTQTKLFLSALSATIDKGHQNAKIIIENGNPKIVDGKDGEILNREKVSEALSQNFTLYQRKAIFLPVKKDTPEVSASGAQKALGQTQKLVGHSLSLNFKDNSWSIGSSTLFSLLTYVPKDGQLTVALDEEKLEKFVKGISNEIDQAPQDAQFNISGNQATVFVPEQDGQKLDVGKTIELVNQKLNTDNLESRIVALDLPVALTKPKITNDQVNKLGIKELIGRGWSSFAGSIAGRVYNIKLAASRINGNLIAPGETYSFDGHLGDVSETTGYQTAYIIEKGRTVFGAGGGVCQVSTTTFRAALNAGLPIVERHPHAYRVGYYEQAGFLPGLDATIYYPTLDLKFTNNTPDHILIHAYVVGSVLYIDLYGTKDGKQVIVSTPKVTGQIPPPPDLYQDDPTLPKGVVKQADFSAWGADASVARSVTLNGQTTTDTFYSHYQPWQAIYLVGTAQ